MRKPASLRRGFYSFYISFDKDAEPDEVAAVIRLALIGGGETPQAALDLVNYYVTPPRPLKAAYLVCFECLNAAWLGIDPKKNAGRTLTPAEMDNLFVELEAGMIKGGKDLSLLRGKSFAEIQAVFSAMKDETEASAPDADTFNAIKAASKKGAKK